MDPGTYYCSGDDALDVDVVVVVPGAVDDVPNIGCTHRLVLIAVENPRIGIIEGYSEYKSTPGIERRGANNNSGNNTFLTWSS